MSCGIHTGCKMFISVHQCMRNTLNVNKEILIRRKFNTLRKALRPIPLLRFSHRSIEDVHYQQGKTKVFLKKHQFVPLICNLYSNDSKPVEEVKEEKQSIYKRFKTMFKEYWYVLLPVHVITSCIWFGSFYYLAISGVDIPLLLGKLGAPDSWIEKVKTTNAGNLFFAYTLYKVMTPIRYTVTVGGTTLSINRLKTWGWIKPVPNAKQIRKMYEEQKDALKDLKAGYQDKMQVTKNEFLKAKDEMKKQIEVAKEEFHKSMSGMRQDFKDGIESGAQEWKIFSKSVIREVKQRNDKFKEKQNH